MILRTPRVPHPAAETIAALSARICVAHRRRGDFGQIWSLIDLLRPKSHHGGHRQTLRNLPQLVPRQGACHRFGTTLVSVRLIAAATTVIAITVGSVAWGAAPQQLPTAQSKTEPGAYWPTMRHDLRNTGASDLPGLDPGTQPWAFQTGKGIFATPTIAADGTIYAGSADNVLYGLDETGKEVWRFETGEIIDTAPALLDDESLIIGSGDENMYKVSTDRTIPGHQRVIWSFKPTLPPVEGQLVSWWEGSPNIGPDGVIYQGNTGGAAYAVNPDGSQKWAHQAENAVWTVPAMDDSGVTFWGSVDTRIFALNPDGSQKWQRTTLGYVTSSPALDTKGTLYAGSFDGTLYALDATTGDVTWDFKTGDHIYSSPALIEKDGDLQQIVVGSTDGLMYSLDPSGNLLWTYDTGAPIRSSPVVGQPPVAGGPPIVYVGAANGHLVAVNANDGSRRWAFDTTSTEPTLATRNQLNSSPALGPKGIYLGSQDGAIWYVPYDFCLRPDPDPRCVTTDLPDDGMYVFGVNVGGGLVSQDQPVDISPAGYMTGRILLRRDGRTVPARLVPAPDPNRLVTIEPDIDAEVSVSGDGRYVFVRPTALLPRQTRRSPSPSTDWRRPAARDWATSTSAPVSWNRSRAHSPCAPAATERRGIRRSRTEPRFWTVVVPVGSPAAPDADQRQPDRVRLLRLDRRRRRDREGRHRGLVRRRETRRRRPHRRRPLGAVRLPSVRSATGRNILVQHLTGESVVHVRPGSVAPIRPARHVRRIRSGAPRRPVPRRSRL